MTYSKFPPIEATAIADGIIVNADVDAAAAIALSKLAATTASRALVSDASGVITPATTTSTEIGYVNGVTSAIQTQLNAKVATSSLGTGVATFLATPSSANLAAALTDETGSGAAVFATSPVLTTPNIGTPSAGTLTNCTGLPQTGIGATVYVLADTPTSSISGSYSDITSWTERTDTNSAFNPTTGVFTAPSAGIYLLSCTVSFGGTFAANQIGILQLMINDSAKYNSYTLSFSTANEVCVTMTHSMSLSANDTVKLQSLCNATSPSFNNGGSFSFLSITKIGN